MRTRHQIRIIINIGYFFLLQSEITMNVTHDIIAITTIRSLSRVLRHHTETREWPLLFLACAIASHFCALQLH